MSFRVRFPYITGKTLAYSIERLSDGLFFDFSNNTFVALGSVVTLKSALTEGAGVSLGRYSATYTTTPVTQFSTPDYAVSIHDTVAGTVVAVLSMLMTYGDDATPITAFPFGIVASSPAPSMTNVTLQMLGGTLPAVGGLWVGRSLLYIEGSAPTHLTQYGMSAHSYSGGVGPSSMGLHTLTWTSLKPLAIVPVAGDVVQIATFGA